MNIYYHPLYTYGIDANSSFPRERYELIYQELVSDKDANFLNILEPPKAKLDDIYLAHSKNYVDRFINKNLSMKEIREIGLQPWNEDIVNRTLSIVGGSLKALDDIYKGANISANMAGGTHHAHYKRGSGFCIFNDLAICALKAIKSYNFKNILIIDLDVHQGDGTASILKHNKQIFTFSMHCKKNFPFKKEMSDLDISVDENIYDDEYLNLLKNGLKNLEGVNSDIIFYQAGVDTLAKDRFGKLKLSIDGINKRNHLIFEFTKKRKNPILIFMGGGYTIPIKKTVEAFKNTFINSSKFFKND